MAQESEEVKSTTCDRGTTKTEEGTQIYGKSVTIKI